MAATCLEVPGELTGGDGRGADSGCPRFEEITCKMGGETAIARAQCGEHGPAGSRGSCRGDALSWTKDQGLSQTESGRPAGLRSRRQAMGCLNMSVCL